MFSSIFPKKDYNTLKTSLLFLEKQNFVLLKSQLNINVNIKKNILLKETTENDKISKNNNIIYQYLLWRLLYSRFLKSQKSILLENQNVLKNSKNLELSFNMNENINEANYNLSSKTSPEKLKISSKKNFTKLKKSIQKKEEYFLFSSKKNLFLAKQNSFFSFYKSGSNPSLKYFFPYQKSFLCYWLLPFVGFVFTLNQQINSNILNNQQKTVGSSSCLAKTNTNIFTIIYKNQPFSPNFYKSNNIVHDSYFISEANVSANNISLANKNFLSYLVPNMEIKPSIQPNLINLNKENYFADEAMAKNAYFMNFTNQITNSAVLYLKSLDDFIEFSSYLPNSVFSKHINFLPNEINSTQETKVQQNEINSTQETKVQQQEVNKNKYFFNRKKIFKSFWLNLDILPISTNKTSFFFINEVVNEVLDVNIVSYAKTLKKYNKEKKEYLFRVMVNATSPHHLYQKKANFLNDYNLLIKNTKFVNSNLVQKPNPSMVSPGHLSFGLAHKTGSGVSQNKIENKKNRYLQALFLKEKQDSEFTQLNMNYSNLIYHIDFNHYPPYIEAKPKAQGKGTENEKNKHESIKASSWLESAKESNKNGVHIKNIGNVTNQPKQSENKKLPLSSYLKLELLFDNFIKKELLEFKPYLFKTLLKKELKNNNPISLIYINNKINNKNLYNETDNNFIFMENNLSLLKEWPKFFNKKSEKSIFNANFTRDNKTILNYKKLSKEQLYKLLFNSFDSFLVDKIESRFTHETSRSQKSISEAPLKSTNKVFKVNNTNFIYNNNNTNFINNEILLPKQLLKSPTPSILLTDPLLIKQNKNSFLSITHNSKIIESKEETSNEICLMNLVKKNSIIAIYNKNLKINPFNLSKNKERKLYNKTVFEKNQDKIISKQKIKNEYINYSLFIKKLNLKIKNLLIKKQLKKSSFFIKYFKLKNLKLQNMKDFFIQDKKSNKTSLVYFSNFSLLGTPQPLTTLWRTESEKQGQKMEKLLRTYFSIKNKRILTIKEKKLKNNSLYDFENHQRKKAFYNQIKQEILKKHIYLKTPFDFKLYNIASNDKKKKLPLKGILLRNIFNYNNYNQNNKQAKAVDFKTDKKDKLKNYLSWWQSEQKFNKIEQKMYSPRFLIKNRSFILTNNLLKQNQPENNQNILAFKWPNMSTEAFRSEQNGVYEGAKEKNDNSTLLIESEIKKTQNEINVGLVHEVISSKQRKYIQKKRRRKKLKKETRRRKKRKRFYPRPSWLRYRSFLKFLNKRKKEIKTNIVLYNKQKQNKREKLLRKYYSFSYNLNPLYTRLIDKVVNSNKDQQMLLKYTNLFETKETIYKEIQQKSENLFSMHITNKDNFIISRAILIDFKRLLWKSYWLRSNLNPYLKRVKNFLIKIKESKQKWEFFQNLNIFFNYMAGFNLKTRFLNNYDYDYDSNQLIKDLSPHHLQSKGQLNQWENTLYFAEYNRITYYRIQEFISQIRENFATLLTNKNNNDESLLLKQTQLNVNLPQKIESDPIMVGLLPAWHAKQRQKLKKTSFTNMVKKSLKVRSSHLSHSKMQDNKRQNIISRRKTTDFWVKLGKALMADNQSSTISGGAASQAQINEKTYFKKRKEWWLFPNYIFNNSNTEPTNPQIRIIWALSKITPSLNSHLSVSDGLINRDPNNKSKTNINSFLYKRRKTWSASPESSKFREQTKYNKTKKMYRDLSIKLQTLLNEQNDFLFKFYPFYFEKINQNLPNLVNNSNPYSTQQVSKNTNMVNIASYNKTLPIFQKRFLNKNSLESFNINESPQLLQQVIENNTVSDPNLTQQAFYQNHISLAITKQKPTIKNTNFVNVNFNNQLLTKLFKKVRQKEEKSDFLNKNLKSSFMMTKKGIRLYKKMIQINKKNSLRISLNETPEFFIKEQSWFNNLTNKTSFVFWWTIYTNKIKNIFNLFLQKDHISYTIPSFYKKENVLSSKEKQISLFYTQKDPNESFLKTAWVCALLFHFCSILSLISFSQIRDLLKFYLLGISKIYKISLGILEYIYNSYYRFKLVSQANNEKWVEENINKKTQIKENKIFKINKSFTFKESNNEKKAYQILDKILINYLNKPNSMNLLKNFINKNKIFAYATQKQEVAFSSNQKTNLLDSSETYKVNNAHFLKKYERKNQSFLALKILTKEANHINFNNLINFFDMVDNPIPESEKNKKANNERSLFFNLSTNKKKTEIETSNTKFALKITSLFYIKKFLTKIINLNIKINHIWYTKQTEVKLGNIKNIPVYLKNYTKLYSLFFLYFIIKNFYGFTIATSKFLKQSFDLIGRFGPKSIFNFLEKPGELIIDWIAYMFLVEWSSDMTNTIPENVDIYLGTSYYKFIRTFHSLNFLNILQSLHIYEKSMINNIIPLVEFNFKNTNHIITDSFYWQNLGTSAYLAGEARAEKLGITNLNLSILNLGSTFIQNRLYHLYEILLYQFYQPDSDLIIRQKKGIIFWDIWGDFLMQVAEDSNINISELTSLKEEQIKLLEKSLSVEIKQPMSGKQLAENNYFKNVIVCKAASNQKINPDFMKKLFINHNILNLLKLKNNFKRNPINKNKLSYDFCLATAKEATAASIWSESDINVLGFNKKENKKIPLSFNLEKYLHNRTISKVYGTNSFWNNSIKMLGPGHKETNNFVAQQFLSYQGKDTELFIDLHPPKSFTMISLLKKNESVQTSIGSLVCQIFSGIMSKQISKNILVVGSGLVMSKPKQQRQSQRNKVEVKEVTSNQEVPRWSTMEAQKETGFINNQIYSDFYQNTYFNRDNQHEKTLLIQAIAGETELKIITDNAYRYAMVYRGVAVGIKLLRDVFDSLSLHTPCLFLIEDIHAIGERRPLLISDDEKGSSPNGKPVFGSQREEIHEKNQVLYQLSKHVISHYRKPYKGDFSLLIPTNHFCFDLFKPNLDSFNINKINPSSLSFPSAKIFVQSKSSNDTNQTLNDSSTINSSKSIQEKNFYKSRLLIKSSQLFSPPATSPFSVLNLKEQKKFQPYKIVSEMPWGTGLRQSSEQIAQLSKASYSIRVKVAVLADMAISTLSVKLDMITDLLVIIDSVKGNRGFVVFATTHMPYVLDPALRRPGRLDETITLGLFPNLLSRWNILKSSFGLFIAGKQQTGFKNGLSLDLTYSIQNPSLPYLLSSVFYSSKSSSIFMPPKFWLANQTLAISQSDQLFSNNSFSYSFFTKNKNISKYFFTISSIASPCFTSQTCNKLLVTKQNTSYFDGFWYANAKKQEQNYRNNKKRIKILSQTYFIASNLLYEANINVNFNIKNKKENFLDFLQPLNIETSLLYISLYTSPQQFQNSVIKLMSGKLGEIFLFSNLRINNLYAFKNQKPFNQMDKNEIIKQNSFKKISDFTSFGLSNSWKILSSLILSFVQKRYLYSNNLIIPKFLDFTNKNSSCPKGEVPSPPSSNIFLPARRYENYRRSFAFFAGLRSNTSIGIMEKIQTHQQQRLIKRLYGFTVTETFKSEVLENRFTSFTNANLMIGSFSSLLQKPSNSNWFFKNRILMRHKNYLTNQWWNAQLPEHNAETTFLSDIDWRYTFVELIGDLLLDFPDADQHYNPKNRRWLLTKGDYHNWFNFEKNFYNEIYTHFIFNSFIKAYNLFENNREVLDFYAFYILQKGLYNHYTLNEFEIIKLFKRFL